MTDRQVGDVVGPFELPVLDEQVQVYGDLAQDHNPIHYINAAARTVGLDCRIAHGMISGTTLSLLLARELGEQWLATSRTRIRFVSPLPVGSTAVASATVVATDPLSLDLLVQDQTGRTVITGTAVSTAGQSEVRT